MRSPVGCFLLVLAFSGPACQRVFLDDPPVQAPPDHAAVRPPASTLVEPGVRRDIFLVDGFAAPANPDTGGATPAGSNATQVLRYRTDAPTPLAARAIVLAMPGFLGGGASFDALARALVREGIGGEPLEVWAIDRRSNLLEDLSGMDAAEILGNPEAARGYYFGADTVGGVSFAGFLPQGEVDFMSEWGLTTHAEDLRRVLGLVPAQQRRGHVFLMGHSLGASFTEAYAAWRFSDGTRGAQELAGLILLDGVLGAAPLPEDQYRNGTRGGFFSSPGVNGIRKGTRYTELPLLGLTTYTVSEISALRVSTDPGGVREDRDRDNLLRLLLGLGQLPGLTNRAVLGFAFDAASNPLAFASAQLGGGTGGTLEEYDSFLGGRFIHPSDPTATYDWIDGPKAGELTSVADLSQAMFHGRSNFYEWYFPARLSLDLAAVGGARIPEGGYQAAEGLAAFDGAQIEAPVLAVAAGLVPAVAYEAIRARVGPTVGTGRPQAGATRNQTEGFEVLDAAGFGHLDPVTAAESATNPVPGAIRAFLVRNAEPGLVSIP